MSAMLLNLYRKVQRVPRSYGGSAGLVTYNANIVYRVPRSYGGSAGLVTYNANLV